MFARANGTQPPATRSSSMLEHLPHWLGQSLASVRAGSDKLVIAKLGLADAAPLNLSSPAFADGARLPERFTADADGDALSPPLVWNGEPEGTRSLVLVVEDPDAPASEPFVHALLFDIAPATHALDEGAIGADDGDAALGETGRNSYFREGWLPPDPPTGHGTHHYVFQLFALDTPIDLTGHPGRSALVEAIDGHVLAAGMLTGTYSRGEENGDASMSDAVQQSV